MKTTTETKNYISCKRCEKNNWDDPEFWGCPRGCCEVEVEGEIVRTRTLTVGKNSSETSTMVVIKPVKVKSNKG